MEKAKFNMPQRKPLIFSCRWTLHAAAANTVDTSEVNVMFEMDSVPAAEQYATKKTVDVQLQVDGAAAANTVDTSKVNVVFETVAVGQAFSIIRHYVRTIEN